MMALRCMLTCTLVVAAAELVWLWPYLFCMVPELVSEVLPLLPASLLLYCQWPEVVESVFKVVVL